MSRPTVRRALPVVLLSTLVLALPVTTAAAAPGAETLTPTCSPAPPVSHPGCGTAYEGAPLPDGTPNQVVQLSGDDRYATAVAIARHGFPQADVAVLVSGEDRHLVDALSAGPLARTLAAPVLLAARDAVPAATADYLRSTGVQSVLLVGGDDALSATTPDRLRALGITDVQRVAGADRYATSRALAAFMPTRTHGWAASGEDAHLVDALAAAGPAARLGEPLVLVADDDPIPAGDALRTLGVTQTTVAGGPEGVAPEALAALPAPHRAAGTDRYATAALVADESVQRGVDDQDVVFAPGVTGHLVDALAAGPLGRATLLVGDEQASYDAVEAWFETYGAGRVTAVGAVEIDG
ncbi:cell wall-binding repeat-containing protein [Kineococcus rhizosphaerae]|uniref:Putative cell wall binding repeat protein n=1 Tax=Kineococcus rhizosphaerae TaxID=559628 RepID=A0A2T0QZH8_9ACTN|nr:cell wall-binding repeat-containing protein [Kineococcus rhizosphaerae]PRY12098.1 putative cell wall binding repeat protein [Kineococcus rhizosphaerae]